MKWTHARERAGGGRAAKPSKVSLIVLFPKMLRVYTVEET